MLFGVPPKDHPAVLWVLGIVKSSVGRRLAVPGVISPLCYIDCLCPPSATANHAHRHYIIVSMHVIGSTVSIEEWTVYFMTFLVSLIATCLVCHLDCYFCTPSHLLSLSDMIHSPPPEEYVTSGNISVFVKYGVVPYFSKSFDLCKTLDLQCPVKAGAGTVTVKHIIPEFQSLVSL